MFIILLFLQINALVLSLPPDLSTPYEKSKGTKSATYQECIDFYTKLDNAYEEVKMVPYGTTDSGNPLHLVILSLDKDFNPASLRQKNKRILLVQNGIHPGEPEGIDASMQLARDFMLEEEKRNLLKNLVLIIIPVYNIGGALNRNSTSRVNQDGPREYGFRGNARNLNLNRDYLKAETENTKSFTKIFQEWQPDVFVDTHTSNGADYQHIITLIPTQKDKLNPHLSQYLEKEMLPQLYASMERQKFPLTPYVETKGETPDTGLIGFMESPRYSTGYAALFNTIGFMTETHMLKPFHQRVKATYVFLNLIAKITSEHKYIIAEARKKAIQETVNQKQFPLAWRLDTTKVDSIYFRGFTAKHKLSEVSNLPRLYYDRKSPWAKNIPYYNTFKPVLTITKPTAYIIPQGWLEVINRLKLNKIKMRQLTKDSIITANFYYFNEYKTSSRPFEGHYIHSDINLRTEKQKQQYYQGDYIIYVNQPGNLYILETLEPQAGDSFFTWGFFDSILDQKEYFSNYVFEDIAAKLLKEDATLLRQYEEWKTQNPAQIKSAQAHLNFIYQHSKYYEKTHLRYPVARVE